MSDSHEPVIATAIFEVNDIAAAVVFYQQLGLQVDVFSEDYAIVIQRDGELLHLAAADNATPGSVYFNVPSADAWHVRCVDAGGEPTTVEDRPWGMREFSVADPSGNTVRVGANL